MMSDDVIMSQAAAAERAWEAAVRAEQAAERESFQSTLMWSEVARSWAAVAGQLEFVTAVTTTESVSVAHWHEDATEACYRVDCHELSTGEYCTWCANRPCLIDPPVLAPDALTEQTAVVPTVLPQRDPGATLSMPVPLCYCPSGAPYGHVFGSACA